MAVKNTVAVYIDGINRTPNLVMPVKLGDFLDERLDECRISLRAIRRKIFQPLTTVEIVLTSETYFGSTTVSIKKQTRYYIIAEDSAKEVLLGKGLYNHELYLIEATKFAECVVVDTITFTNDLGRSYTENAGFAEPVWE